MVLTILSNHGMLSVGDVIPYPKPRFRRRTLPRLSLALILGDGGPEEAEVSVEEGGTKTSASKLNVFCTLVGGADRTSLSVESKVTAAWRREKGSLGIRHNLFEQLCKFYCALKEKIFV